MIDDIKRPRGRPRRAHPVPNAEYLEALQRKAGKSQKEVAALLSMDDAVYSRSKKGNRPYTLHEAATMANVFGVSLDELIPNLGYRVAPRGVAIVGKITSDSGVSSVTPRKGEIVRAPSAPPKSVAYVSEVDGAVFIVDPRSDVPPDAFGRLCVVEADNDELPLLGTLGKAASRGSVALTPHYGDKSARTLKTLHSASIVTAIIFP